MDEAKIRDMLRRMIRDRSERLNKKSAPSPRHINSTEIDSDESSLHQRDFLEMTDWTRRNLLGLKDLSKKINTVLDKAQYYRDGLVEKKNWQDLRGKRIINLFMEPSTRTRVAFELAAKSLLRM